MMLLALKLFLAHLLGDFLLQPDKWVRDKDEKKFKSRYLYLHVLLHAFLLLLLLQFQLKFLPAIGFIVITHFLIDLSKLYLEKKITFRKLFFMDQAAHLLVLFMVVWWYYPMELNLGNFNFPVIMLFTIALLLVTSVSAIIMRLIMSKWVLKEDRVEDSLPNAGKYIGILERLFVFTFIVLNQWQAIGLLIAAKSILRFSDLSRAKDRKLTEYVLIGTLLSFGLAMFIGLIFNYFFQTINNL
jgi:hypothetical protein